MDAVLNFQGGPADGVASWNWVPSWRPAPEASGPTLGQAVAAVIASKTGAGYRPTYLKGLRRYLVAFARGRETTPVGAVTSADIEEWFRSRGEANGVRAANLGRLGALFSFARRKAWIGRSPVDGVERVRIHRQAPRILSVDQVASVMAFAKEHVPSALAYLSLGVFAGVRPEELARVSWDAVQFESGVLVVDAAASKVHRRRLVPLTPNTIAWLRLAQKQGAYLPMRLMTRRRAVRLLRVALGVESWPQDILRHTSASYALALHLDAAKVALALGNSPNVLMRHYVALVGRCDAERFWLSG